MPAQSSLLSHLDGSKGTCIDFALFQTKQLLINVQNSQLYLTIAIITTTTTTTTTMMMMITTMTILTAWAAEASPAIRTPTVPAENLVHLLLQQLLILVWGPLPLAILPYILLQLYITSHKRVRLYNRMMAVSVVRCRSSQAVQPSFC
jgi:hypothetical protein